MSMWQMESASVVTFVWSHCVSTCRLVGPRGTRWKAALKASYRANYFCQPRSCYHSLLTRWWLGKNVSLHVTASLQMILLLRVTLGAVWALPVLVMGSVLSPWKWQMNACALPLMLVEIQTETPCQGINTMTHIFLIILILAKPVCDHVCMWWL